MSISIFELFSIGIGPSSSHTVGPMRAALRFAESLKPLLNKVARIQITLYGSLAFTGRGHGTDKAVLMGLEGSISEKIDPSSVTPRFHEICAHSELNLLNEKIITFELERDLIFNYQDKLPFHSNGMHYAAFDDNQLVLVEDTFYSIGGGFILNEQEARNPPIQTVKQPYPFDTADELLEHCKQNHMSIHEVMLANEKIWHDEVTIKKRLLDIIDVMFDSIERGCNASGNLPGTLKVPRRAPAMYQKLKAQDLPGAQHPQAMSWLDIFAMAVNEENAAGARVVTAPTNGAAGIIPAVMKYYQMFCDVAHQKGLINFLLTAGAIGILYKKNASISGAEMGCQGEVGVACSMAAGGLAAVLGGSPLHVENAAEIGIEHNLGLTCDPVGGLVQIPCIERNAMGAVKAVNATQLALAGTGEHKVSLDMAIKTMREIGDNMNSIYKETSKGGLAVNVPEC